MEKMLIKDLNERLTIVEQNMDLLNCKILELFNYFESLSKLLEKQSKIIVSLAQLQGIK